MSTLLAFREATRELIEAPDLCAGLKKLGLAPAVVASLAKSPGLLSARKRAV